MFLHVAAVIASGLRGTFCLFWEAPYDGCNNACMAYRNRIGSLKDIIHMPTGFIIDYRLQRRGMEGPLIIMDIKI